MHTHLADLVTSLAERAPDMRIYTFLDPDGTAETITARRLSEDAGRIASILHAEGVSPGDIVPLVFDHGYELVAAFWGAMHLGAVPTILPYLSRETRSRAYLEHVGRVVRFAQARSVVTMRGFETDLDRALADATCRSLTLPADLSDVAVEALDLQQRRDPSIPPYIQFSSGTTGAPKGVIPSHAAVLYYLRASGPDLAFSDDDVAVGWLPLYHDMGLVTQVLQPLYYGHHGVFLSPAAWLREPHRLLTAVTQFGGTMTWMPNFAFRYSTRRIRDEQIAGVDLSTWRILGNGSEPVHLEDMLGFARRFAAYGFRREALNVGYGLAEHVTGVTWTDHERAPDVDWVRDDTLADGRAVPVEPESPGSRAIVSCGHAMTGVALRILDDEGGELPERRIGEVVLQSPCVFKGYYRMPEESAVSLRQGWLHTEDLGYLAGGQLYVCGRKKDLLIVGGRNFHPHHLEAVALSVLGEGGRVAAAFGIANPQLGTETPIVVCEMQQLPEAATRAELQQAIREQLRRSLQLFVGDVHLVDRGWVVRTTSGKINRAANRDKYLAERGAIETDAAAATTAPEQDRAEANATEQRLLAIWESLFKHAPIGLDDDFFELGGDSLLAAELSVEIEEQFRCSLPAVALLESPTIRALARLLAQPGRPIAEPTLVPLRPVCPSSRGPAFFCVHGVGGGVVGYRPLSQALGAEQPFYGLQARGSDGVTPVDNSIEVMAAHYVETIRQVQGEGPYHLGGYCFGGVVAFEMARQLSHAGERVALLAILEGYAPSAQERAEGWRGEWYFALNFLRTLPYWLRDYLKMGRIHRRARNRRILKVARKRLLRLAGLPVELGVDDMFDGQASKSSKIQAIFEKHITAARQYAPTPYDGRIVLFRTRQRILRAPTPDMGWSKLSTQAVQVELIAGSHGTILEEPSVGSLAQKLKRHLVAEGAVGNGLDPSPR